MRGRSPFITLIALVSLVAILLGALEHEDLILQEAAPVPAIAATAGESEAHNDVSHVGHDAGTEGTFRSTLYRFWLSPRVAFVPDAHRPVFAFESRPRLRSARPSSRAPAGLITLRL